MPDGPHLPGRWHGSAELVVLALAEGELLDADGLDELGLGGF
jgi:hypothetical protein